MVRGLVSIVLALVLVAAQLAFVAVLTGCGDSGPRAYDDVAPPDGAPADAASGPDASAADGGDAGLPAACGFGAAPRLKLNGTIYSVTSLTATPEILNCCDAVKYRFVHDDPGFAFAIDLDVRKEIGWTIPSTLTFGTTGVSTSIAWECLRGCVQSSASLTNATGQLSLRGDRTQTLGTLCASLVDSAGTHPVIDTLDLYAVDTPIQ